MTIDRNTVKKSLQETIALHGFQATSVLGGPLPAYTYTIGLYEKQNFELVVAGTAFYTVKEQRKIIEQVANLVLKEGARLLETIDLGSLGSFSLRAADTSWTRKLLLGAVSYADLQDPPAFQLLPDAAHQTVDLPEMHKSVTLNSNGVWRWIDAEWTYPFAKRTDVVTNVAALQGNRITEVNIWEDGEWEMFAGAGPEVAPVDIRIVPIGTLIGADASLERITTLKPGDGLWRDSSELVWHEWR
jgi:hypothetical protein